MIKLQETFISGDGGYSQTPGPLNYKQLARTDTVALYQRFYADGRPLNFEVFKIKILPKGTQIFNKTIEDDEERYPSNGAFGISAWSIQEKEPAEKRFEQLCKEVSGVPEVKAELFIPIGEFTCGEFAEQNHIEYITASNFIKTALVNKSVKFIKEERRNTRGKPSKIYAKN